MKKIHLLFLFLTLMTATASAQFGIKAGVNASRIATNDENIENLKGRTGYQAGLMVKINLSEFCAIQPEALYTRKGARYDYTSAEVTTAMNYLDVPIVLMANPLNLPISFHIGPQFSYLLSTDFIYENTLLGEQVSVEVEKENFEDYDLGMVAGVGFEWKQAVIEFRYTRGFKDYEKKATIGDYKLEPSSNHYSLQASLGYYF